MRRLVLAFAVLAASSASALLPERVTISYYDHMNRASSNVTFTVPAQTYATSHSLGTIEIPVPERVASSYPNGFRMAFALSHQQGSTYSRIVCTYTGRNSGGDKTAEATIPHVDGTSWFSDYASEIPLSSFGAAVEYGGISATFSSGAGYGVNLYTSDPNDAHLLIRPYTTALSTYSSFWASSTSPADNPVYYLDANGVRHDLSSARTALVVADGGTVAFSNEVRTTTFVNSTGYSVKVRPSGGTNVTLAGGESATLETLGWWLVASDGTNVVYFASNGVPVKVTSTMTQMEVGNVAEVAFITNYVSASFFNRTAYPLTVDASGRTYAVPTNTTWQISTTNGFMLSTSAPAANRVEYLAPDQTAVRVTSTPAAAQMAEGQAGITVLQDAWETITFSNPTGRSIDIWTTYGVVTIPTNTTRTLTSLGVWKIRFTPQLRGMRLLSAEPEQGGSGITVIDGNGMPIVISDDWRFIIVIDGGAYRTYENWSTVLFGTPGKPIYGTSSSILYGVTNIFQKVALMTEWRFNQSAVGAPIAYINGDNVCPSHSTTHIIDYELTDHAKWTRWNNKRHGYLIRFSMSLGNVNTSGAACTYRCWMKDDPTVNAEVSLTVSEAAGFTLIYNPYKATGKYKLVAD